MSRFTKFVSAVAVVAALAPFAAQARSGETGSTGPATTAVQSTQHGAFVPGRGSENAKLADNVSTSYPDGRPVSHNAFASNAVPVSSHWVGGAASDSDAG